MSGIAEVLLSLGHDVSGSDIKDGPNTEKLKNLGAKIFIGHRKENIGDASVVVYTSAVGQDNPEFSYAREKDIPILKRAEMLAQLMRLKNGLAVAGTHGKTTTTSLLVTILEECQFHPTYFIGGIVENLNGHARAGKGDFFVAEADESDGSFLLLNPVLATITNIDNDHMDFYGNEEELLKSFEKFANNVPFYGIVSLNAHDNKLMEMRHRLKVPNVVFGIEEETYIEADFKAKNVSITKDGTEFDLYFQDKFQSKIQFGLIGKHNVLNALAAISLAYQLEIDFSSMAKGLSCFKGVGRRLQKLYTENDFEILDDYGHHPTEVAATLKALRESRGDKKIVVVFEPHRYSRTQQCWNDFFHCFNNCDELYLSPIYSASEKEIDGIHSERLVQDINKLHPDFCSYLPDVASMNSIVEKYKGQSVALLFLGAGGIGSEIRKIVSKMS